MIQLNANLFARVAVAQSTEAVRYYLQGVCIQPAGATGKGVTLVATDGHMLIAGNDPKADAASLLPSGGIIVNLGKDGLKAARKGGTVTINPVTGEASVQTHGLTVWRSAASTLIDGNYPDWRRILPQGEMVATGAAFDVKRLSRLGDALTDWSKTARGLVMRGADHASPHVVACDSQNAAIFAVYMPIRVTPTAGLPAWL